MRDGLKTACCAGACEHESLRPYEEILVEVYRILSARNKEHGGFQEYAGRRVQLDRAVFGLPSKGNAKLLPEQEAAMQMMLEKLARIASGGQMTMDNWLDIIGSATLAAAETKKFAKK